MIRGLANSFSLKCPLTGAIHQITYFLTNSIYLSEPLLNGKFIKLLLGIVNRDSVVRVRAHAHTVVRRTARPTANPINIATIIAVAAPKNTACGRS
jgi:hypothetical protein